MFTISEGAYANYLAKVVELKNVRKHPNADRLQITEIDLQTVVLGQHAKDGDVCIFFPVESQINHDFLSYTNEFRDSELNRSKDVNGFFEKKGRVRAVKLRGERSMGYIAPISSIQDFMLTKYGIDIHTEDFVPGTEFDMIGTVQLCKKFIIPVKEPNIRQGKKPRISRLVDGQVHLHVDTENLRREAYRIKPDDHITVSYKYHGTSFWVSNVLVKKKLHLWDRLAASFFPVMTTEYDYVFGSRKVVKNEYETQNTQDFYDGDLWNEVKDQLKDFVPKGYTLYGELVGFTASGAFIQEGYDYGAEAAKRYPLIYRITITNPDGYTVNLSTAQCREFCERYGLKFVDVHYSGTASDLFPDISIEKHWNEEFVKRLEMEYLEGDCHLCVNKVPKEGVVVRKEKFFEFECYKLKSFDFLEMESKLLDNEKPDIESQN